MCLIPAVILASAMTFHGFVSKLESATNSFDYVITGQLSHCSVNAEPNLGIIGQLTNGDWRVFQHWAQPGQLDGLRPGDNVCLHGRFDAAKALVRCSTPPRALTVRRIEKLGHGAFPPSVTLSGGEIAAGLGFRRIVTSKGVIASVVRDESSPQTLWIVLRSDNGKFCVSTTDSDFQPEELAELKDAEVSVTGVSSVQWNWRRSLGHHLSLFGRESLSVIKRPPEDPFSVRELSLSFQTPHREKVSGNVLALGRHKFFLRRDSGEFLPVSLVDGASLPSVGDHVDVAGFVEPDQNNMRLVEAVVRPSGRPSGGSETPTVVDMADLLTELKRHGPVNTDYYGRTIRFSGILNNPGDDIRRTDSLNIQCGSDDVPVDISALTEELDDRLCNDAKVEVTGICTVEFEDDPSGADIPRFKGFCITPRTADDIRILSLPSWWTPFRLSVTICLLFAVIIAILIWNASLRALAARRGRELFRSQIDKAQSDLRTEERTRIATELHDYLTQNLTAIEYRFATADKLRSTEPEQSERFYRTARQMLTSCRTDLRRCLWDLKSEALEEPSFESAIRKTIAPIVRDTKVLIRFNVSRSRFNDRSAHAILSIIRELVTNAINHGNATTIRIAGTIDDGIFRFSVTDDGIGFDTTDISTLSEGHFGLTGVRDRVRKVGATFNITSTPGHGTRGEVTLSLKRQSGTET